MSLPFPASLALGGLALAPLVPAQEAITEERVRAAFAEARAAVQSSLGFTLDPAIQLSCVSPLEAAEHIAAENLPLVRLRQPDPAKAEVEARRLAEGYAQFTFAKYSWSAREFLVMTEQWEENVKQLGRPEMSSDGTLRAVLVHELIHARDDALYDLTARFSTLGTSDAIAGMNGVLEGHAQLEARRVCASAGWSTGFDTFTGAIGSLPESARELDEATRSILRVQSAVLSSSYQQGERFMAALYAAGGEELVARAFRAPPRDGETLFHPEWYLDPGLRPKILYDLEPALDRLQLGYPESGWTAQRMSLQPAQIEAALALLPPERARSLAASVRAARALSLQSVEDPTTTMIALSLMEFESSEAARTYLAAAREVGRLKAQRMKTGTVRITSSESAEMEPAAPEGFLSHIQMKIGALDMEVRAACAMHGSVVLDMTFVAEPMEPALLASLTGELLDAVRRLEEGPARR